MAYDWFLIIQWKQILESDLDQWDTETLSQHSALYNIPFTNAAYYIGFQAHSSSSLFACVGRYYGYRTQYGLQSYIINNASISKERAPYGMIAIGF